ncbi:MAG: alcohol dehydrogenase [Acidimicrobiaceae bacterium]|jgi:threonine dehydrogenase-like Zn-dependent dehydrogenase|nr:alcohol dehydrogenase [Acidimicrobiaceae bacterium]MBO65306.1 alcohol dehydrogenase [Actinomycetota bacterium]MCH2627860.1 zinc-binding dehydrogenase [Acidimicrobiales bacterium]MEC9115180.1 zinc-binding dehydrogenase [Actinomycetota bacterium]|tara:strand:- start:484 stop:1563 length:1080 start_codon:yes stop_codon:yes gene_type:complete
MRAAFTRQGKIVVDTAEDLVPSAGEVLVKTLACGICGSDLHALRHGHEMVKSQKETGGPLVYDASKDLIMGHEFCAEILEVGSGVPEHLTSGDIVCSMPVLVRSDGIHTIGYSNEFPGGYAEHMLLSSQLLLPVRNGLSAAEAALTEPMAVGRHAVEKSSVTDDDVCLVIGCGPVGLAVIAALKQKGLGPVLAADFSPRRRELAEWMGADEIIDPAAESPYESWQDAAWPEGVDRNDPTLRLRQVGPKPGVVFECVGVPGVIDQIMHGSMRDTRVVVVGVCMEQDSFRPLTGIGKEINIQFVLGYTQHEFADTLRGISEGELVVDQLITGRVGLDGVAQAFDDLNDPEVHAKIVVEPWK